ncbi:MAG: hypothetical protein WEA56_16845 [Balneolaceae bacterium]
MKSAKIITLTITLGALLFAGCKTSTDTGDAENIYPMYVDSNGNTINDYVEEAAHEPGPVTSQAPSHGGAAGHAFTDSDGDGICDYAQDGSSTWHGPGFVDENNNGICDYWDESHPMHRRHNGMRYQDQNRNHINDYFEQNMHRALGHEFIDENEDGICDYAQDGSPSWHGPGYSDENNNGICDHWESGGQGHGGGMMGIGPNR